MLEVYLLLISINGAQECDARDDAQGTGADNKKQSLFKKEITLPQTCPV